MAATNSAATLESSMKMQACRVFWHRATLRMAQKHQVVNGNEVLVLHVTRSRWLGGNLDIGLGPSIHPVRMLPVSGKDVRCLRFGLVYGSKRKRVRFRAPDATTYDDWELMLESATETAAAERPAFAAWSNPCVSPASSEGLGRVSEVFCFESDAESEPEPSRAADSRSPTTGSFVDFSDTASWGASNEREVVQAVECECEARVDSFERGLAMRFRGKSLQSRDANTDSKRQSQYSTATQAKEGLSRASGTEVPFSGKLSKARRRSAWAIRHVIEECCRFLCRGAPPKVDRRSKEQQVQREAKRRA